VFPSSGRKTQQLKHIPLNLPLTKRAVGRKLSCLKSGKQPRQAGDPAQQTAPLVRDDADNKEFLQCSQCQYPITRSTDRIEVNARHEHVFVNPHGYIYQIGCFARAPGCLTIGPETGHFSWFPGYTWQVAICGRCSTLLGWAFQATGSRFFGLILVKLSRA
jgi:hypothetical protein